MDHIGIDVHKKESQLCILSEDGERREPRVRTTPARFADVLGDRPRARILLEASTESEWVARCLERLGHEVIVADPNFAPMYATRTRRIKTDRRDARALAEACRLGAYRPAHRLSDAQRHVRGRLMVRDALVRTRTGYISVIRALLRQHGWRVPTGSAEGFIHQPRGGSLIRLPEPTGPLLGEPPGHRHRAAPRCAPAPSPSASPRLVGHRVGHVPRGPRASGRRRPSASRYGYDTQDLDHLFAGPDRSHWLGTDQYGRDLLTRVLDGARVSLTVGLTAVLAESLLGVAWGTIAGFASGRLDRILMGAVDVFLAFPALLLAVLITGIFGTTLVNIVVALMMTALPGMARTVRSEVVALRGREHVEAARALGAAPRRILVRHLVPNTVHLVTARATLDVSAVILIEATLSFIGIGVQPPRPSWGLMISESFQFLHSHPFLLVVPATVLSLTVIAFNLVGQALTERLDPSLRWAA